MSSSSTNLIDENIESYRKNVEEVLSLIFYLHILKDKTFHIFENALAENDLLNIITKTEGNPALFTNKYYTYLDVGKAPEYYFYFFWLFFFFFLLFARKGNSKRCWIFAAIDYLRFFINRALQVDIELSFNYVFFLFFFFI
jgi:hypothetical protein